MAVDPELPRAIVLEPNEGCLTLARRLARRGVEVVGLCSPRVRWAASSRALRGVDVAALPQGRQEWVVALRSLADRPGVLICGSDAASELLLAVREEVPDQLVSFERTSRAGDPDLPLAPHEALMDKDAMVAVAQRAGVPLPLTRRVDDAAAVDALVADLRGGGELAYPVVAKPVVGHVGRQRGAFVTRRLDDEDALVAHLGRALAADVPMVVSEEVPGPVTALECAIQVRTADGGLALQAARRKVRGYDHGVGTLAEAMSTAEGAEVTGLARRLLEEAGYVGVAATEFKRDARTGRLKLIEVNVRLPANFGVYDAAGVDASWRVYATLAGLPLGQQPEPLAGRRMWLPQHDARVLRGQLRAGEVSWRSAVTSLLPVRDAGALSWRDPAPAWSLLRQEVADRR